MAVSLFGFPSISRQGSCDRPSLRGRVDGSFSGGVAGQVLGSLASYRMRCIVADGICRPGPGRPPPWTSEGGGESSEDHKVCHDPLAGHVGGDVVSFGSRELRGEGQGRPLTIRWEVEVAAGKRGDLLALEQTAAIWDMLAWLAARKQAEKDAQKLGDGRPPASLLGE